MDIIVLNIFKIVKNVINIVLDVHLITNVNNVMKVIIDKLIK